MEKKDLKDKIKKLLQEYPEIAETLDLIQLEFDRNISAPIDIDYSLVKHIDMGKSGIATAEQPLIATDSLATCTGILAFDLENGFAFLAHSDAMSSFFYGGEDRLGHPSISKHVSELEQECRISEKKLQLTVEILPGMFPDREAINTIRNNLEQLARRSTSTNYSIGSIKEARTFDGSILFNSRTGERYPYDKKKNPYYKPDDSIDKYYEALSKVFFGNDSSEMKQKK